MPAQTSDDMRQILERLDRLEEQNRALAAEVRALRKELATARGGTPEPGPAVEQRLEVQESRTAEQAQAKVEASQHFPLRITGMVLFNTFLDSKGSGGFEYPNVALPGQEAAGGATLRQTILGLDYSGPRALWGGKIEGSLRMDFWGGTGAPLDQTVRLRTGTIGIDWQDRSLLAGVDKPIISPREPNSLAQVAFSPLAGAGNLWLWIPQVRFEQDFRFGESSGLLEQVGAVETRVVNGAVYEATTPSQAYAEAARPGVEARLGFFTGADRRIELASGIHHSVSHIAGTSVPSDVYSVDWLLRPWKQLEFIGAAFTGQNVAPLGTGPQPGVIVLSIGHTSAVHSRGGWGQLTYHTSPRSWFNFFSGQQNNRNADFESGAIGKNLAYGANFFYSIAPNVLTSFEVSQTRTSYIGVGTLLNNHYDLALAYLF